MDRKMFARKDSNSQSRVDRFMLPRSSLDDLHTRRYLHERCRYKRSDLDGIKTYKYMEKKKYKNYLERSLGIDTKKLSFPQPSSTQAPVFTDRLTENHTLQAWPCVPRKKRYLASAGSVLDLPSFGYAIFTDLLDWGNNDILVAALGREYYNWSWKSQNLVNRGLTRFDVNACKFEPSGGGMIAFGTVNGIEIHDGNLCKWLLRYSCNCSPDSVNMLNGGCSITCLDWSPTGNSFATGCNRGGLTAWSPNARVISRRQVQCIDIINMRISPDARFIACMNVMSCTVQIFSWPYLQIYYNLDVEWFVKAINWHPWRSSLLCAVSSSAVHTPTIALWDAAADRTTSHTISRRPYQIDNALFNKLTGELVLTAWISDRTSETTALVVLQDPYTVVDMWYKPESCSIDQIRKIMFSPDGTKLATATADEDLLIWNFLPENSVYKNRKTRNFYSLPVYLDYADRGFSLR